MHYHSQIFAWLVSFNFDFKFRFKVCKIWTRHSYFRIEPEILRNNIYKPMNSLFKNLNNNIIIFVFIKNVSHSIHWLRKLNIYRSSLFIMIDASVLSVLLHTYSWKSFVFSKIFSLCFCAIRERNVSCILFMTFVWLIKRLIDFDFHNSQTTKSFKMIISFFEWHLDSFTQYFICCLFGYFNKKSVFCFVFERHIDIPKFFICLSTLLYIDNGILHIIK